MLIILHCKSIKSTDDFEMFMDCFGVDRVYRAETPIEMEGVDTDIVDDVTDGKSVLLVVPTHSVGITYATAEECLKLGHVVHQLKSTQRSPAQPIGGQGNAVV